MAFRNPALANYHRLPRSAFRPLRITAWLQCGVITDGTLPIDSVLYYQAHREAFGARVATTPGASDKMYELSSEALPLARCEEHTPQWYYAASFAQWPDAIAEGSDHWNKRLDVGLSDLIDFGKRKARVDTSSSAYKAYHMPVFYRHALAVRWYVMGEPGRIRELLSVCTHLGKKVSQGWGAVLRWEVEEWPEDWSVRGPSGELMRAIPADEGILVGYRPSYWLPKNQAICTGVR